MDWILGYRPEFFWALFFFGWWNIDDQCKYRWLISAEVPVYRRQITNQIRPGSVKMLCDKFTTFMLYFTMKMVHMCQIWTRKKCEFGVTWSSLWWEEHRHCSSHVSFAPLGGNSCHVACQTMSRQSSYLGSNVIISPAEAILSPVY